MEKFFAEELKETILIIELEERGLKPRLCQIHNYRRVYTEVPGLAAWSDNCKWYSSLPLGAVVSLFCEFCRHNLLCCFSTSVYCCYYFVIVSVQKLSDTLSYSLKWNDLFLQHALYYCIHVTWTLCECVDWQSAVHITIYTVTMTTPIQNSNFPPHFSEFVCWSNPTRRWIGMAFWGMNYGGACFILRTLFWKKNEAFHDDHTRTEFKGKMCWGCENKFTYHRS
jgi:hypothetical protein